LTLEIVVLFAHKFSFEITPNFESSCLQLGMKKEQTFFVSDVASACDLADRILCGSVNKLLMLFDYLFSKWISRRNGMEWRLCSLN